MYFCKICGRQLEKKGDICIECYEGLIEAEENENDTDILFSFKAKYSFIYEIMKAPLTFILITLLLLFAIIVAFQTNITTGILTLIVYTGLYILYFLLQKIRIQSRKIDLYRTKLIYTRKLHLKNYLEVKYSNIQEIQFQDIYKKTSIFTQSSWWLSKINKKFKMTELFFKLKKTENTFLNPGFFIAPIQNFNEDIMPKLMEIMNFSEITEEKKSAIEELLNINKKDKENKENETDKDKIN